MKGLLYFLVIVIFISAISIAQPISSTYLGGGDKDGNLENPMVVDGDGNVFIASRTRSTNIIPPGTLSFDNTHGGGGNDVIVAKFDSQLSTLLAATYIGGSGNDGAWPGVDMTIDASGNIYIAGRTNSATGFPIGISGYQDNIIGGTDAFIVKLNNDLTTLIAATFIGGSSNEYYSQVAINNAGNVVLCGTTNSSNFPIEGDVRDSTFNGGSTTSPYPGDLFIAVFNPDLDELLASTYIGGYLDEFCEGVVFDGDDNIYLTGWTSSSNFPTESGYDPSFNSGYFDAYVTKVSSDLSLLIASTFVGGSEWDFGYEIILDNDNNVIMTGHTASTNYPTSSDAYDRSYSYGTNTDEGVITKFSNDLTTIIASTYFGGSGFENVNGVAVDGNNNLYICGATTSDDIPMVRSRINSEFGGDNDFEYAGDGYVAYLNTSLTDLLGSTYLGGSNVEVATSILLDSQKEILISGSTNSSDFPTTLDSYDPSFNGGGADWSLEGSWGGDLYITRFTFDDFTKITEGPQVNDGGFSFGVSWIDYNNDDYPDLFVSNWEFGITEQLNFLYSNNGDGTYTRAVDGDIANEGNSVSSTWADYDSDGDIDCYTSNSGHLNYFYTNNGDGTFEKLSSGPLGTVNEFTMEVEWIDYNNDGFLDLFATNHDGSSTNIKGALYQNIDGEFTRQNNLAIGLLDSECNSSSWGDYDNDGDRDLFWSRNAQDALFFNNTGDGTFTQIINGPIIQSPSKYHGSWADIDNDGDLDIYTGTTYPGSSHIYINENGEFNLITEQELLNDDGYWQGGHWGDYDNDGYLDLLILGNQYYQPHYNRLFHNNGNGTFTRLTEGVVAADSMPSSSAAWADHDRDGDLDLYVVNVNGYNNCLYENNGNSNGWIQINCIGTNSNRSAIGAKIRLKAMLGGIPVWQLRVISAKTGFMAQNSLIAHFGLGDAEIIDSIKVEWPSGMIDILTDVAVNQYLTIDESIKGDANGDGDVNVGDAVYIINNVFKGGPAPDPVLAGDANCDEACNVGDAVYIINHVFKGGPEPCG